MQRAKLIGVETANPAMRLTQDEVFSSWSGNPDISDKAKGFYERFLSDKGIESRHFGISTLNEINEESPDEANRRFEKVATQIGAEAVRKCLYHSKLTPSDIDALIVTTCTGYLCPGLTSYISEAIGLRESIYALDLTGLGCGAAIPAMRSGYQYLESYADKNVMVVSVEVCSAASSWGDEIDLILSNSIFSDGAAACLLSNKSEAKGYEILQFQSLLWPQYRDQLRFKKKDSRLCNVINRSVPGIAAKAVKDLDDKFQAYLNARPEHYGVHPGGRRVLDAVSEAVDLDDDALKHSRSILKQYGNMSSPSILYVFKEIMNESSPVPDEHIALYAFGAGFSAFGVLLKR